MQTFPPIRTYVDDLRRDHVAQDLTRKPGSGALRQWWRAAAHRWKRRKMIAALDAMDDRLLRDIGIYRGDIPHAVDRLNERELGMRPLAPSAATPVETHDDVYRKAA